MGCFFERGKTDFTVRSGYLEIHKKPPIGRLLCIGVTRFELMTFCSQSRRSTRLSYTPSTGKYRNFFAFAVIYDLLFIGS